MSLVYRRTIFAYLFFSFVGLWLWEGAGELSFHMLFLKDTLFYFVEMVSPLTTLSFCDTFKSGQRK